MLGYTYKTNCRSVLSLSSKACRLNNDQWPTKGQFLGQGKTKLNLSSQAKECELQLRAEAESRNVIFGQGQGIMPNIKYAITYVIVWEVLTNYHDENIKFVLTTIVKINLLIEANQVLARF